MLFSWPKGPLPVGVALSHTSHIQSLTPSSIVAKSGLNDSWRVGEINRALIWALVRCSITPTSTVKSFFVSRHLVQPHDATQYGQFGSRRSHPCLPNHMRDPTFSHWVMYGPDLII
jgi:hypothetical protein